MKRLGLTAGDPAGIGLEILLRALPDYLPRARWVLFANRADFLTALERFRSRLDWKPFDPHAGGRDDTPGLWFFPVLPEATAPVEPGRPSAESGRRALAALARAADEALSGALDGIVTAPLSKQFAGPGFTGQTEYLQERTGADRTAMAFFTPTFKVVLATTHVSLRDALDRLSVTLYGDLLRLVDSELPRLGFPRPRIAVSGVNPHAGEHGMFGREDDEILAPAVRAARDAGLDVSGPWPADSCYQRAHRGEFDVVVAPYHDQGLVPVKLIAPGRSTNVTLGLRFLRTSPDHGTAFDIAGRGVARLDGMASALDWALSLTRLGDGDAPVGR